MKRISIDGGKTFCTIDALIDYLSFDDGEIDFDTLGYYMGKDVNAFYQVMYEARNRDYTVKQLIELFLELAKDDLIIEEVTA
jgi:hypothetical protein